MFIKMAGQRRNSSSWCIVERRVVVIGHGGASVGLVPAPGGRQLSRGRLAVGAVRLRVRQRRPGTGRNAAARTSSRNGRKAPAAAIGGAPANGRKAPVLAQHKSERP